MVSMPHRWVRAAAGWTILLVGLLFIDDHVGTPAPYDDDSLDFGMGYLLAFGLGSALVGGVAIRNEALLTPFVDREPRLGLHWLKSGAIPVAVLVTVAFHHWLSNRLAGVALSLVTHAAIIGLALVVAGSAIIIHQKRRLASVTLLHIVLTCSAALSLLVIRDVWQGWTLWSRAKQQAGGRPHCVMTYGGFEHQRRALNGWELSPLVNRHYGTWAVAKAPVLIVANGRQITSYRWTGNWRQERNEQGMCTPTKSRP